MIIPVLSNVGSSRGAPMGRPPICNDLFGTAVEFEVHLHPMVDDCYDEGGAYWGMNSERHGSMYRVTGYGPLGINDFFIRATSLGDAKARALTVFPNATFTTEE